MSAIWNDSRLLNAAANALFAFTFLALLVSLAWWVSQRPLFTLAQVRVQPGEGYELRRVAAAPLRAVITRRVHGNFFTVDLDAVRAVFESVPWVRHAAVRRVWPDGLEVSLEEHRPFAFWDDGRIVNTFGELFVANLAEAEDEGALPHFSGPEGSAMQVARRYVELVGTLAALGVRPRSLALSARYAWTMRLDDGTTLVLGRDQDVPIERRVARWVETWPTVVAALGRRAESVDLRYPNGFAIRSLVALGEPGEDIGPVRPASHPVRARTGTNSGMSSKQR